MSALPQKRTFAHADQDACFGPDAGVMHRSDKQSRSITSSAALRFESRRVWRRAVAAALGGDIVAMGSSRNTAKEARHDDRGSGKATALIGQIDSASYLG